MGKGNTPVPPLTDDERRAAGRKGVEARRKRAAVKEKVNKREITIFDVLDMDDEDVKRMKVVDLLKAIPAVGETKADWMMREVGIAQSRRLAGLGKNQRAAIKDLLERKGWR